MIITDNIYLLGLNSIRTIILFFVVISHIGLSLEHYRLKNFDAALANCGVTFFFGLSVFLITYLLFKEKKLLISLLKIYIRRKWFLRFKDKFAVVKSKSIAV